MDWDQTIKLKRIVQYMNISVSHVFELSLKDDCGFIDCIN